MSIFSPYSGSFFVFIYCLICREINLPLILHKGNFTMPSLKPQV